MNVTKVNPVELRTVDSAADLAAAERIYMTSFPPEERRQWSEIADKATSPQLLGIYTEGKFAGIVTTWQLSCALYVEHLAIADEMRGCGCGTAVLEALKLGSDLPVVAEIEPEGVSAQAAARLRFYVRARFAVIDRRYVQPPYGPGLPPVDLWLIATDVAVDARQLTRELHRTVYGVE